MRPGPVRPGVRPGRRSSRNAARRHRVGGGAGRGDGRASPWCPAPGHPGSATARIRWASSTAGVDPLLRLAAGVGGAADDLDPVPRRALAAGLQRTTRSGALQHETGRAAAGLVLDQRPGGRRADLLVPGDQQADPGPATPAFGQTRPGRGSPAPGRLSCPPCRDRGSPRRRSTTDGSASEPDRPDGVVMGQEHHPVRPGPEPPPQVRAAVDRRSAPARRRAAGADLGDQVGTAAARRPDRPDGDSQRTSGLEIGQQLRQRGSRVVTGDVIPVRPSRRVCPAAQRPVVQELAHHAPGTAAGPSPARPPSRRRSRCWS